MLPDGSNEDIEFFGGKDYLPLFARLTIGHKGRRIVHYNSKIAPTAEGFELRYFETRTRTNWHYECVAAFLDRTNT